MTLKENKKLQYGVLSVTAILGLIAAVSSLDNINAEISTVEPDYLAQANIILDEIKSLDDEIEQIKLQQTTLTQAQLDVINTKQQKINDLFQDISALEKLNMELYNLEPEKKQKLYDAEKIIYEQYYLKQTPESNILYTMGPDFKSNTLGLFFDSTKLAKAGKSQIQVQNEFTELLKNEDVQLTFSFSDVRDISCSSKTANCTPVISAISGGVNGDTDLNTLGYKATKGADVGFVMAAHSANDNNNANIVQSHTSTRLVGNVDAMDTGNCDCAFVHADQGIGVDAEIWKNSSSNYDITGKTNDASQSQGTWVYKVGASSGLSLGQIATNSGGTGLATLVKIYHAGGDSGSTVFTLSGDNANVYGMLIGSYNSTHAVYQPQDYIQTQLVITTSTS